MTGQQPKVSVCMITYNQERYIAQAIDSVLVQQTDFSFEIVIGDDCSTDRTREILRERHLSHPDRIRLLTRKRNLGMMRNFADTLGQCRGEYVAILEGDDYWTSAHKLQQQVDALDAHPDWTVCFHWAQVVYENGERPATIFPAKRYDRVLTIADLLRSNCIQTCSVVYRRVLDELPAWLMELGLGDWPLHILHADRGGIGFLPEEMAVYRIHSQSTWSSASAISRYRDTLAMLDAVDRHFGGRYHRQISTTRNRMKRTLFRRQFAAALWGSVRGAIDGAARLGRRWPTPGSNAERTTK